MIYMDEGEEWHSDGTALTKLERYHKRLNNFCLSTGKYTIPELYVHVNTEGNEHLKQEWDYLAMNFALEKVLKHVRMSYEATLFNVRFSELIRTFDNKYLDMPRDKYESPRSSYELFIEWCAYQRISIDELIERIVNVMDRRVPKLNTLAFFGDTNSGKSVVISRPLAELCRSVGRIANIGANSEFCYQDCINKRVIVIDECVLAREQLEFIKVLIGGENMFAGTKHTTATKIPRIPIILTGNRPVWQLDYTQQAPMETRCYIYETRSCSLLKGRKSLHPLMWRILLKDFLD